MFYFNEGEGVMAMVTPEMEALKRVRYCRRRVVAWAKALEELEGEKEYILFGLSYRPGEGYKPRDIYRVSSWLKRNLGDGLVGLAWIGEMQERGAVHYLGALAVRPGVRIPKLDEAGIWPWGATWVEKSRTKVGYLVKYASKLRQKGLAGGPAYPRGIRIFNVWIAPGVRRLVRFFEFRLSTLPVWLARVAGALGSWPVRRHGGGWEFPDRFGAVAFSPWDFVITAY